MEEKNLNVGYSNLFFMINTVITLVIIDFLSNLIVTTILYL